MPKYQIFGNKSVLEPGAYSQIKGGDKKASAGITTGTVVIIDTGIGAGYGGGSGSLGTKFQGKKSIYSFSGENALGDFREWMRGGLLWDIAKRVFIPSKSPNVKGAQELLIIQARQTAPATITLTFTNGSITIGLYAEGVGGNGVINGTSLDLQTGFAAKLIAGSLSGQYQLQFNTGTYRGVDENGADINNISPANSISKVVFQTNSYANIPDLVANLQSNKDFEAAGFYVSGFTVAPIAAPVLTGQSPLTSGGTFAANTYFWVLTALNSSGETIASNEITGAVAASGSRVFTWPAVTGETAGYRLYRGTVTGTEDHYFAIPHGTLTFTDTGAVGTAGTPPLTSTAKGAGVILSGDLTTLSSLHLFTGGTETYSTGAIDEAIESVEELDNVYFLCTEYGITNGIGTNNTKLFISVTTDSIYQRLMVVGGGGTRAQSRQLSSSSAAMAAYFNSASVFVCHDNILEKNVGSTPGFRALSPLYLAATVVGKMAGNAPQKPITWEDLDVDGVPELLKLTEREDLLKAGVIHLKEVAGALVVNQEVTTLQQNDNYVYPDGQSPEGSLMRISAVLNKTLKQKLERRFTGSNQNLSSPADVQSYMETILHDSTSEKNADNLIIGFQDVKVQLIGSDYTIAYSFFPNGPINRLFVTGFMFSPNISI